MVFIKRLVCHLIYVTSLFSLSLSFLCFLPEYDFLFLPFSLPLNLIYLSFSPPFNVSPPCTLFALPSFPLIFLTHTLFLSPPLHLPGDNFLFLNKLS